MRVNIDEIKEGGLARTWDLTREQLDEMVAGDRAGYRARGPAKVEVRLERLDRRVRVTGKAVAPLSAPCGRCLGAVAVDVPADLDLTLVPADARPSEEDGGEAAKDRGHGPVGGTFEADEAEEETYTGKTVDLDPFVREALALAAPAYPVCGDACKGLCSVCGKNLNEGDCGCDRHVPDPRWAGLKNVKL